MANLDPNYEYTQDDLDNRSRQLNPEDEVYELSRGGGRSGD